MYYQLDNFYQNHRRYVKSRSFNQLQGNYLSPDQLKNDCDPIIKNSDLGPNITRNVNGALLNADDPAIPCGLVAKSFFNDTYSITYPGGAPVTIDSSSIAWDSDVEYKFKNIRSGLPAGKTWQDVQWLNMEDRKASIDNKLQSTSLCG